MNPFTLTEKQEKLLAKLEKAYKNCIDAKMYPVNIYGSLTFYNAEMVSYYGDSSDIGRHHDTGHRVELHGDPRTWHSFKIPNEFCDDPHIIFLTEKGAEALKEWEED